MLAPHLKKRHLPFHEMAGAGEGRQAGGKGQAKGEKQVQRQDSELFGKDRTYSSPKNIFLFFFSQIGNFTSMIIRQAQEKEDSSSTSASVGNQQAVYVKALLQPFLDWRLGQLQQLVPLAETPAELAETNHSELEMRIRLYTFVFCMYMYMYMYVYLNVCFLCLHIGISHIPCKAHAS